MRQWAKRIARERTQVQRIAYFGSYARGDWSVGSDLDLIIIVDHTDVPFERRGVDWDTTELPVPTDVLVYTQQEWKALQRQKRFYQTLINEAVWIYGRD